MLYSYMPLVAEKQTKKEIVSSCENDEESSCCSGEEESESCCQKENCCTNVPVPVHFSISVIVGEEINSHSEFLTIIHSDKIYHSNQHISVLSDGFLNTLYKPPAA
ncbi:MAG: hypothetical protein SFY56_04730 [Bacteroidota bacterium]|nr:hypothetical protein [Bacteroidota bacterium]